MMLDKLDTPGEATLYDEILLLCQEFGLHTIYLFGSRAGEVFAWMTAPAGQLQPSSSDIDVGVRPVPSERMGVRDKVSLAQALEVLFQEQRVDLVLLDEADPFLAANVIRGVRLYTVDDYEADEYELYVLRRAADLAPFERARQAMVLDAA